MFILLTRIIEYSDVDPYWLYVGPDTGPDPQNLMNVDPDPDPRRIKVNKIWFQPIF